MQVGEEKKTIKVPLINQIKFHRSFLYIVLNFFYSKHQFFRFFFFWSEIVAKAENNQFKTEQTSNSAYFENTMRSFFSPFIASSLGCIATNQRYVVYTIWKCNKESRRNVFRNDDNSSTLFRKLCVFSKKTSAIFYCICADEWVKLNKCNWEYR